MTLYVMQKLVWHSTSLHEYDTKCMTQKVRPLGDYCAKERKIRHGAFTRLPLRKSRRDFWSLLLHTALEELNRIGGGSSCTLYSLLFCPFPWLEAGACWLWQHLKMAQRKEWGRKSDLQSTEFASPLIRKSSLQSSFPLTIKELFLLFTRKNWRLRRHFCSLRLPSDKSCGLNYQYPQQVESNLILKPINHPEPLGAWSKTSRNLTLP